MPPKTRFYRSPHSPPIVDLGSDAGLIRPMEYRQAKGAFGDEMMTLYGGKGLGQPVIDYFIIAGGDPDFAVYFDPYLGRAGHVTGRVKRHIGISDPSDFAVGDTLGCDVAQTVAHDGQGGMGGQIAAHAPPRMV